MYGGLVAALVVSLCFRNEKARAGYYGIAVTVFSMIIIVTKLYYADPRPFWVSDDV